MILDGEVPAPAVVLDTNIVLDLLVFRDPSTRSLADALAGGSLVWHATAAMRDELRRVLDYPVLQARLARSGTDAAQVLAQFDRLSRLHAEVGSAAPRCRDPDDQKFIDLARVLQATLLSKDQAVLRLRRALSAHAVKVAASFSPGA